MLPPPLSSNSKPRKQMYRGYRNQISVLKVFAQPSDNFLYLLILTLLLKACTALLQSFTFSSCGPGTEKHWWKKIFSCYLCKNVYWAWPRSVNLLWIKLITFYPLNCKMVKFSLGVMWPHILFLIIIYNHGKLYLRTAKIAHIITSPGFHDE
jgi:hypothetical protein